MHLRFLKFLITVLLVPTAATVSHADILFYEGFNYDVGANGLVGQTGGVGFGSTAWTTASEAATTGVQNAGIVAAGSIGFSDFATFGNVGQVQNDSAEQGQFFVSRELPNSFALVAGSTVYQSYLFRQDAVGGLRDVSTAYSSSTGGSVESVHNRVNTAFGFNDPDSVGFGYDATAEDLGSVYAPLSSVLVINKLENINGSGSQTGTQWILSESNFDAIKAGGVTEAELNANNLGLITETVSGVSLNAGDHFQIRTRTQSSEVSNAFFDEVKLFTDLNDLQLTPTNVPEPSSLLLLISVGMGRCCFRRRR